MAMHMVFTLVAFWSILHAIRQHRRRAHATLLPALSSAGRSHSDVFRSSTTHITLRNFHLGLQSTALNSFHHSLTIKLSNSHALLGSVYDAGSLLGVLGMVGSVLLLVWTSINLVFYHNTVPLLPPPSTTSVQKRAIADDLPLSHSPYSAPVHLIIPGVTTPLYHLPILLVALLTTQIIHEAGHAIAAALESVPLSSVGLGFTVILPSAFVSLPTGEVDTLSSRSRARVISAGPFHNILFWLVLTVAQSDIFSLIWPIVGYRDVSAYGRVIVGVERDSSLYGHLPIGAVVYKVGDAMLDNSGDASKEWDALLSRKPDSSEPTLGWCAEATWFTAQSTSCCGLQRSSQACFASFEDHAHYSAHCVDPLQFLDSSVRRCASAMDCGHGQVCVGLRGDQELVSLTMHVPPWLRSGDQDIDMERTVVWQGDRGEIFLDVEVGDWLPRSSLLPMGLPALCGTFFMYLEMLTLSLYFFNLLPLPFLDGGQLFDTFCIWSMSGLRGEEFLMLNDLESGTTAGSGRSTHSRTLREQEGKWRWIVHYVVGVLLGLCVVFGLMEAYSS